MRLALVHPIARPEAKPAGPRWRIKIALAALCAGIPRGEADAAPAADPEIHFSLSEADCDAQSPRFISKQQLGKKLANAAGLVGPILNYLAAHKGDSRDLYEHLYGDLKLNCKDRDPICEADDRALKWARNRLDLYLRVGQPPHFQRNSSNTDIATFFSMPDRTDGIACPAIPAANSPAPPSASGPSPPLGLSTSPQPQASPALPVTVATAEDGRSSGATPLWAFGNLRVRGYAQQIPIPHATLPAGTTQTTYDYTGYTALFDATTGASINFKYSNQNETRSDSFIAAAGYQFNVTNLFPASVTKALQDVYIVPYAGVDRELTNKASANSPTVVSQYSTNFADFGVAATAELLQEPPDNIENFNKRLGLAGYFFIVRPDYLLNYLDNSRLVTTNIRFVPVAYLYFNQYGPIGASGIQVSAIADIRDDNGWFVDKGNPKDPRINHDFVRIGGRGGAAFNYNFMVGQKNYPIDFISYYTDFYGASGFNKSLGEFESSLVFNFGEDKLLNVTLQYRNGRREDTMQRDQAWTAGLSVHY